MELKVINSMNKFSSRCKYKLMVQNIREKYSYRVHSEDD